MGITATAIYENGILRLLTPLTLPEHTQVQVHVETVTEPAEPAGHVLHNLLALATDLGIADLAEEHDHYLYGVEKR